MPPVSYPGSIGLNFDWDPEPEKAAFALLNLEAYLENTAAPVFAAKLIAIRDTEEHFYREEDPEGDTWPYWADSYARTAEIENVGILRKTEELFYKATDPSAYQVLPHALYFDTSDLPPYWSVHQYGDLKKPRGKAAALAWKSPYYSGTPGGVPQRAFLGLSAEAQEEIDALFFKWLETGGEVFMRGGKAVESHVFQAPTGHFISAL